MSDPDSTDKSASLPAVGSSALVRRPRHKWFSAYDPKTDEGWWGPHQTIEEAAMEALRNSGSDRIFVAQGRKLTKEERYMPEWDWEVDARNAVEIVLPNTKLTDPLATRTESGKERNE